jgi:hypothetical protein
MSILLCCYDELLVCDHHSSSQRKSTSTKAKSELDPMLLPKTVLSRRNKKIILAHIFQSPVAPLAYRYHTIPG